MARTRCLLDTNILLYALSTDPQEIAKRNTSRTLMQESDWATSIQVQQEFYANAIKPQRGSTVARMTAQQAEQTVLAMLHQRLVVENTADLLKQAMQSSQRYQISLWDAGVLAAAQLAGVPTLYSEDLNHGQTYDGVLVVNPFLATA